MQAIKKPPVLKARKGLTDWCYSTGLFSIQTEKAVMIQNIWYGSVKWAIFVIIIIYISFCLWSEKLYQRKEPLISSVHTKVKGIAEVTVGNNTRVFDSADYTFSLQGNSFFVITNFLTTEGQTQGICPEVREVLKGCGDPMRKPEQTGLVEAGKVQFGTETLSFMVSEEGNEELKFVTELVGPENLELEASVPDWKSHAFFSYPLVLWLILQFPTNNTCCSSDKDCEKGRSDPLSKGIQTGKCVKYNVTKDHPKIQDLPDICKQQKTCEVSTWCPTETRKKTPQPALLASAENFTVLIKNSIHFPGFNYSTRNILPETNIYCTFHKTLRPDCPIFRLGDVLQETGANFSSVAIHGGIVGIEISWDCNLDAWFHSCSPKYSFRRLEDTMTLKSLDPENSWLASVLSGSFRYAKYYMEDGIEKRTLIKAFGIRFDILVFGTGGKFDIIQLIVYIGSTLSYFGLATVLINFLIQMYTNKCCRSWLYPACKVCESCSVNEYYYEKKYETIGQPIPTSRYVSFVDEPYIRLVNQDSLMESLQDMEGEKISRPQKDFKDLDKMSPSSDTSPSSVEIQLLNEEPSPPSHARPEWCRCGHCRPSQLPESNKRLEELCCRRKEGPCITTSALFEELVLSRATLRFILLYQEPFLEIDSDALNNRLRHCAYGRYIDWRFGSKDMADLAILPSCCRWKIRERFPKQEAKYTGFRNPNRHKQSWRGLTLRDYSFKDSPI